MIKTGDKLVCTTGNACYQKGDVYTVGEYLNDKFFEVQTGCNDECWYATTDKSGIYIRFENIQAEMNDAFFDKVENQVYA